MNNSKSVSVNNETAILVAEDYDVFVEGEQWSCHDAMDALVMFANLTDRPVALYNFVLEPIWFESNRSYIDRVKSLSKWLNIDMALLENGRSSFTYEELPDSQGYISFIVESELAARGAKEGRIDLIALPPCGEKRCLGIEDFDLINISGVPVGVGGDNHWVDTINPDPYIRPYYVDTSLDDEYNEYNVSGDAYVHSNYKFHSTPYAVLGLPPRQNGTLYLARWGVAALAHIGGRTDVIGVKGSTPYV